MPRPFEINWTSAEGPGHRATAYASSGVEWRRPMAEPSGLAGELRASPSPAHRQRRTCTTRSGNTEGPQPLSRPAVSSASRTGGTTSRRRVLEHSARPPCRPSQSPTAESYERLGRANNQVRRLPGRRAGSVMGQTNRSTWWRHIIPDASAMELRLADSAATPTCCRRRCLAAVARGLERQLRILAPATTPHLYTRPACGAAGT